jgi:hypothetical protein
MLQAISMTTAHNDRFSICVPFRTCCQTSSPITRNRKNAVTAEIAAVDASAPELPLLNLSLPRSRLAA